MKNVIWKEIFLLGEFKLLVDAVIKSLCKFCY